jgi:LmbE family N-acetylglucosaminyl deacetylase
MAELGEQAGGASTDGESAGVSAAGEGAEDGSTEGQAGGADGAAEVEIFTSGDEDIAAWVDCSSVADLKLEALRSHASQADNVFFVRLPPEVFRRFFSVEAFVLASGRGEEAVGDDDLFSGLV